MKWKLWKIGRTYFLTNNEDGWLYVRDKDSWHQTWFPWGRGDKKATLIGKNYKQK